MLRQDQLEIISPGGAIQFYNLEPGQITYIGQHPDDPLRITGPDGTAVRAILDHRQKPYRLMLLSEVAGVQLEGQPLPVNHPGVLRHGSTLELAGYVLILLENQTPLTGSDAAPAALAGASMIEQSLNGRQDNNTAEVPVLRDRLSSVARPASTVRSNSKIVTELSERCWTVEVEEPVSCRLTIMNGGRRAAAFTVSVVGLDDTWVDVFPPTVNLAPGEKAVVGLTITLPKQSTSRAGVHHWAIGVTSPHYPGLYSQQAATLIVKPYYDFAVGELSPRHQSLSLFKRVGRLTIPIINKGNSEATLRLTGVDELDACLFEFQPPDEAATLVGQAELRLSPGEAVSVPVRLRPRQRPLLGFSRRAYPFNITVTAPVGRQASRSVLGRLTDSPFIGPWLTSLLTVGLVALLLVGFQLMMNYWRTSARRSMAGEPLQAEQEAGHKQGNFKLGPFELPLESAEPELPKAEMTYEEMFQEIAPQYGLDWRLLAELAYQESRMNPLALGKDFDMGMMQIIPSTWNEWAPKVGVTDPYDPYSNIQVGAAYLAYVRDYSQARGYSEEYWALVGYNWGPDNLRKIFENQGGFEDVPEKQRRYALAILQARGQAQDRWKMVLEASAGN
jgi:membrane-bound lytic murein transglycosylase F